MNRSDFATDFAANASSPAAQLFVARAQSVSNHFALMPHNAPAVAEICRRLDGLPLALELAASLIEMLTPQEIVTHLSQRFDMLNDTPPIRPPRHQSLRAVIASSVDLLTESERALLRRLSVFVGGWTLEAAQALYEEKGESRKENVEASGVSPFPYLLFPSLRSLVAKSLVVAEETNGQMRYRMLETIGEYAGEMLAEAGEAGAIRVRHLEWMTQVAQQAEKELTGPGQSRGWNDWKRKPATCALRWIGPEIRRIVGGVDCCWQTRSDVGGRYGGILQRAGNACAGCWMCRKHKTRCPPRQWMELVRIVECVCRGVWRKPKARVTKH